MCSKAHAESVLKDLGIWEYLSPVLISDVEGLGKPSISIFLAACVRGNTTPLETLHVGDDFHEDYRGADNAGLDAILLRRTQSDEEFEPKGALTKIGLRTIKNVNVVKDLYGVVAWVEKRNMTREV